MQGEPAAAASRPTKRLTRSSSWHPDCYQRAVAYVTDPSCQLLVFEHIDADAGTQVPAGGIHEDESPEDAVRRELLEEAGLDDAVVVRKLGEAWNQSDPGDVPPGLEQQILHVYHLKLTRSTSTEEWEWEERSGGDTLEHCFAFRWVTLDEAARVLLPAQAMWITAVALSLRHP